MGPPRATPWPRKAAGRQRGGGGGRGGRRLWALPFLLAPWGCLGSRTDAPGSRPALLVTRGGWEDLQPRQGGGEGRAGRTPWTSCEEAAGARDLPASWPRHRLPCAALVAPLPGPAPRAASHPGGSSSPTGRTRGGCSWKDVGDAVTKAGFQTCSSQSSKGSGWRPGREKSLKKKGRKIILTTWRHRTGNWGAMSPDPGLP